jgi:hypothetical protein
MGRFKRMSRTRKVAIVASAMGLLGAGITLAMGTSQAAENCAGLDKALQNNQNFIAGQQANPDANSQARIANRQAVIDLIEQRREAAGCTGGEAQEKDDANQNNAENAENNAENAPDQNAPDQSAPDQDAPEQDAPDQDAPEQAAGDDGGDGDVVCPGSTVTLSGEGGAPAASSGEFPVGTQLKVTNLDNDKSTTVEVSSVSGSCVLLNNAAFEQVREPGKNLIRRAVIERVG